MSSTVGALDTRVERARPADRAPIEELLRQCGLPAEGIAGHLSRFLVARRDGRIIGCAGLERYGGSCVLRSLAVAPEARGRGAARDLIRGILHLARDEGCTEAYLLTLTIERLARRHGFTPIARDDVPPEVRGSSEFALRCCASAIVMHRSLS